MKRIIKNIRNWFIWKLIYSPLGFLFFLFFGTFAVIGWIGERNKNNSNVQVMKEDVMYIRPRGFEEVKDTLTYEEKEHYRQIN